MAEETQPDKSINISDIDGDTDIRNVVSGEVDGDVVAGDKVARDKITTHYHYETPATPPPPRDKDLTILLNHVRQIWTEDFLDNALLNAIYIELGLREKPDAVPHLPRPFEELNIHLAQPDEEAEQDLPAGKRAYDIYQESQGSMLILGQPGAGKTTILATLARDLLAEAEDDPALPVPVIFNLSSWTAGQKPLVDWLEDELNRHYQIPRKLAQSWLAEERLALLLDGLDEVAEAQREACVSTINSYRENKTGPLVVCSRLHDYEALQTQLDLRQAIVLKALERPQVEEYFHRLAAEETGDNAAEGRIMGLFERIWQDEALQALTQTPLMLNIITLTYASPEAPPLPVEAGNALRAKIFDAYSERMFNRKGRKVVSLLHPPAETVRYLRYLATQLQAHGLTQFSVGQIRGTWLLAGQTRRYRWLNWLTYGLSGGLSGGLLVGLLFGLVAGLVVGLLVGLLVGLSGGLSDEEPAERLHWAWRPALVALGRGVLGGLLGGGSVGLLAEAGIILPTWLAWGLIGGLSSGLLFGLLVGLLVGLMGGIDSGAVNGALFWLDFIIPDDLFSVMVMSLRQSILLYWLVAGGVFGIITGGGLLILDGVKISTSPLQLSPEQELETSARNLTRLVLPSTLLVGVGVAISSSYFQGMVRGALFGFSGILIFGLLFGLTYGGNFLIQHYLRLWLFQRYNLLPFRLIPFLNQATELIFLQRIGGSYRFIHRSVQEHFAARWSDEGEDTEQPSLES